MGQCSEVVPSEGPLWWQCIVEIVKETEGTEEAYQGVVTGEESFVSSRPGLSSQVFSLPHPRPATLCLPCNMITFIWFLVPPIQRLFHGTRQLWPALGGVDQPRPMTGSDGLLIWWPWLWHRPFLGPKYAAMWLPSQTISLTLQKMCWWRDLKRK